MDRRVLKFEAIKLRKQGKSFKDICEILCVSIPKSTLATWFKETPLNDQEKESNKLKNIEHLKSIRVVAHGVIQQRRSNYLKDLIAENFILLPYIKNKNVAKIALCMLYLGEGGKTGSRVTFGNSDPKVIALFLRLLNKCYVIDNSKLRITVQCRADQDTLALERFWRDLTKIPKKQFYGSKIDPRSKGKPTSKSGYKGVCRIDYFSSLIFDDIMQAIKVLYLGP